MKIKTICKKIKRYVLYKLLIGLIVDPTISDLEVYIEERVYLEFGNEVRFGRLERDEIGLSSVTVVNSSCSLYHSLTGVTTAGPTPDTTAGTTYTPHP